MMLNKVSLNTIGLNRIGLNRIGKPSRASSDRPYIDPEVLASLKAVCICYGKSNYDPDRAVVKNLVDPDNPFVISNAAYTEGSGYADKDSPYYGAFVTDGIDDLITSTKTVQEMDITDEVTVVSMIHQIDLNSTYTIATTNYIENSNSREHVRSDVYNYGKTGIYGYSASLINNTKSDIKNILGDEADYYVKSTNSLQTIFDAKFSVVGRISELTEASQVAWYWTIIANKVLTTDQINQVIAYFNLDRTLNPDILCNTIKQGITNDNHAEFGDKLIDFSGNGRDIQLNNIAWKGDSGIGKYETDFLDSNIWNHKTNSIVTSDKIVCDKASTHIMLLYYSVKDENKYDVPSFSVLKQGDDSEYYYIDEQGVRRTFKLLDGINILPASHNTLFTGTEVTCGFGNPGIGNSVTITQIPSHAGALCLDGVNDFGKVTGMPIYKDYTIVVDYERISGREEALISKAYIVNQGAFVLMETSGTAKHSYSFGAYTAFNRDDFTRTLLYQSKYKCGDVNLTIGKGIDGDTLWLGTLRNNDYRFFNGAIYSLMSFPYSMSEFLIERQLKKHKLGTLYPDMVEFRPVIKSNASYDNIVFYYKNEKVENGTYLTVGSSIGMHIRLSSNPVNEIKSITINGIPATFKFHDANNNIYQYDFNLTSKSPQKINITIDEYIRFEDIVQPYPVLLRFKDENGNEVSWGGKFKVGSTITRIGSAADSNLLPNIYNIFGLLLNGNQVTSSKVIVEKTMVFKAKSAYIFDNNEPKCILSPRLLRIPNSSYKILGYIPDISGHGNNGKINNSAYKLNSGVNGYLVDFTTLKDDGIKGIVRTDSKIYLDKSFNYNQGFWLGRTNNPSPAYKVKVSGIPETGMLTYTGGVWLNLVNGINELPARTNTEEEHGFVIQSPNLDWSNLVIEQIGEYEGAYCLDGVDDFVTIPTIVGGKQVLMKMNWQNRTGLLYDQRKNGSSIDAFAILNVNSNNSIAYNSRNTDGETYIDGILNKNIVCPQLYKITHSITIINQLANKEEVISPTIGSDTTHKIYFSQMSLYDFMLFDDISTEDKIKELNEYVGIEAKVELPPYYWDAYGKTNLDADKATIQQRGVAVGDYDLTNYNHAYNKMSGYGGYSFKSFNDSQDWNIRGDGTGVEIVSRDGYSITIKKLIQNLDWQISNNEYKYPTILDKELPFKCISNKKVGLIWQLKYKTEGATSDTAVTLINQQLTPNVPLEINLPYKTQDELTELGAVSTSVYYLLYFSNTTLEIGEEYTVEMLPLYPNGLLYDAVTDYSENVNIPVFTDFTAIMKRKWLKNQGCPLIKGSKVYEGGNGNALLFEWDKAYNFVFYKRTDIMEGEVPENISFITPTNYNGNVITRGSEQDTNGICIAGDGNAGFANMVFYKLILYPKTIPLLQINFLKNLMERDEIIDLNNLIFIQ